MPAETEVLLKTAVGLPNRSIKAVEASGRPVRRLIKEKNKNVQKNKKSP